MGRISGEVGFKMQVDSMRTVSALGGELVERPFVRVVFQRGIPDQVGINGCRIEDVIQVAIGRLETFQIGPLACVENEQALKQLYAAVDSLEERLRRRERQGVLNTMAGHSSTRTEDLDHDFSATGA